MSDYDKAGRLLIKRNSSGFLRWLVRRPDLIFRSWIDARRLALPDQGDLANDLVAALAVGDTSEALCIELQADSEPGTAARLLLGYLPRLLTEPEAEGALVLSGVGGAVINFTGPARTTTVEHRLRTVPECWLGGGILQRTLREEDAAQTLAEIAQGDISRWLLAWLPLMQGGATADIIEGWKREALKEPIQRERGVLANLTLTFARLAGCQEVWNPELKEWAVIKSEYLEELREDVRAGELQDTLLVLGPKRLGQVASPSQEAQLKGITDLARLHRMRDRLFDAVSWDDLLNTP